MMFRKDGTAHKGPIYRCITYDGLVDNLGNLSLKKTITSNIKFAHKTI